MHTVILIKNYFSCTRTSNDYHVHIKESAIKGLVYKYHEGQTSDIRFNSQQALDENVLKFIKIFSEMLT